MTTSFVAVPSVKDIAVDINRSCISIPEKCTRLDDQSDLVSTNDDLNIPIIDMSKLTDPDFSSQELSKLHHACQEEGFFQLMNHSFYSEMIESIKVGITEFFERPLEKKKEYSTISGILEGYGKAFVTSEEEKLDWADMLILPTIPVTVRNMNLWPSQIRSMASKLVIFSILIFDLIAFGLAVAAEQRRSKAKVVLDSEKNYKYCVYDSDIATGYGVGAFLFLMLSQVIVMAVSKCFYCGRAVKPTGSRACALILFLLCWLTFLIAESCLLTGAVQNAYHTPYMTLSSEDGPSCQTLRKGVFAAGAAFAFFTAIFSEFYYISFSNAYDSNGPEYEHANIRMSEI